MTYDSDEMTTFKGLGEHNLNRKAVDIIYQLLPDAMKVSDLLGQNTPFDILWKKKRLCVRAAIESDTSRFPKWNYSVGGLKTSKVDLYILIAIRDEEIYKMFVLPPSIVPKTTISITERAGFIRYDMFQADTKTLADRIFEVEERLPELEKLYKEAKIK